MTRPSSSSTTPGLLSSYLQSITDQYSDVALECEGHKFSCHRVILAAQSKFFSSLFSDIFEGGDECKHPVFALPGVSMIGLEKVIRFIYSRPMHLTMSTVWMVVKDADFLLMDEVTEECSSFILANLKISNCLGVCGMAEQFHLAGLSGQVEKFILDNLWQMGGTEEFLGMESLFLVRWLQDDRLVIGKEEDVWRLAMTWMEGGVERREKMTNMIYAVRFGLMNREFFVKNIVTHPSIIPSPLLQEVSEYMAVMENPTSNMVKWLMDKYSLLTPKFATPRLPARLLLQIGGFTTSPVVDLTIYDMKSDRWTKLELQLPDGLAYPSAEVVGNKVVLVGGISQTPSQTPIYSRNTWIIDMEKQVVEKGPDMKLRRNFVTSAVVGDTVYAVGGRPGAGSRRLSECEKLDMSSRKLPLNWERIQPVKPGRADSGAVGVGDKVWVVGGFDGQICLDSVKVLNTVTGRWRTGPALQTARSGLSCACLDGWVYAAGGMDGVSRLRTVERIRPGDSRWERVDDMINPRSNFSLVVLEGRLVVAGGFNGVSVTNEVEIFDPETGVWTEGECMVEGKSGMSSVVVDRIMLSEEVKKVVSGKREGHMEESIIRRRRKMEKLSCHESCSREEGDEEDFDSVELEENSFVGDLSETESDSDYDDE